mgnify:CR=1 FL=1
MHIKPAMLGGGFDGAVQVKLVSSACAGKFAQAAQRNLDVARAKLDRVVEILEFTLVPNLDGAEIPVAILPDAYAFGIIAISAIG